MYFYDINQSVFLVEGIHEIPESAISVNEDDFQTFIDARAAGREIYIKNNQLHLTDKKLSDYHAWDGAKWTLDEKSQIALLADKKAEKLAEINTKAQAFVSKVAGLDIVPDYEVKTWQTQGEEAKAWHADKSAVTPNLNAIAAARGIPADVLKAKAYEKTVKFELLTAVAAGLRQGYEDANKAAKTLEEVEKINPIYKLPEMVNE